MSYVFFGTSRFGAIVLEKLLDAELIPAAVITNPDRPAGRKKVLTPSPVKIALTNFPNIQLFQPEKLNSDFIEAVKKLKPTLGLVAAYGKILKEDVLTVPSFGIVGVHPSLLPKFRGASPIQSAILAGEKKTGVSLYYMDAGVDSGAIIAQTQCTIEDTETTTTLTEKLGRVAAEMLIGIVPHLAKVALPAEAQDEALVSLTKKFTTEDAFIPPAELAAAITGTASQEVVTKIDRAIRAFVEEPGAWTEVDEKLAYFGLPLGKRVKIISAVIVENQIELKEIQIEGKKPAKF